MDNPWFKKGFKQTEPPPQHEPHPGDHNAILVSDIQAAFSLDSESTSKTKVEPVKPTCLNAFDIISLSPGFDLSGLFEKDMNQRPESRFTTTKPASMIVSKFEELAETESFKVKKKDGMVQLQCCKTGRKGNLAINAEIFEVTPSFHVVEVKKTAGDTLEYNNFCNHDLKPSLKDIVWSWQGSEQPQQQQP